jgi:hypothetical protein
MATLDEKDIESVGAGEGKAAYQFDKDSGFGYGQLDAFEDMSKGVKVKSEARAKAKEDNKIEVQGGSALNKFFNLDENQQSALLEQIGLENQNLLLKNFLKKNLNHFKTNLKEELIHKK